MEDLPIISRTGALTLIVGYTHGNITITRTTLAVGGGKGGTCNGTMTVGVPHDRGKGSTPIDDGQLFDSTEP